MHRGRALGRGRGAAASTSAPAASWPSRSAPVSRRSGSACTATTSRLAEIREALAYGVGRIVVDSFEEIDRVASVAAELGVARARHGAGHGRRRGAHPRVHRHRPTRTRSSGSSLAGGQAAEAAARSWRTPRRPRPARPALATSAARSSTPPASRWRPGGSSGCTPRWRRRAGCTMPELDLGGGYGIAYTSRAHTAARCASSAQQMADLVGRELKAVGDGDNTRVPAGLDRARPRDRRPEHLHALRGGDRQGRRGRGGHSRAPTSRSTAG